MFKKLFFRLFGTRLDLGHVVEIPKAHPISYQGGNNAWHSDERVDQAYSKLYEAFSRTPACEWLSEAGPHIVRAGIIQDWGNQPIMEWFQHPVIRAELRSIRFMDPADAVTFKLKFL